MSTINLSSVEMRRDHEYQARLLTEDEKWAAVLTRNIKFNGILVFGVRSTGIYCKPSCPAKRPKREQVRFFSNSVEAELEGFRPCKRCHPQNGGLSSSESEWVHRVCNYIEANLSEKITLSTLGVYAGVSPYHLQRTFKRVVGLSPRQYAEARRLGKMKRSLRNGETVTKALYAAGFSSRSRYYEKKNQIGVNAGTLRRGGAGLQIDYTIIDCPLGRLLIGATERGVCAVSMGDTDEKAKAGLSEDYPLAEVRRNDEGMLRWVSDFMEYFSGQRFDLNLPVDVQATAFQWRVWKEIQSIPYGSTTTYSKIARSMGAPESTRAVARACATNRVSLVIPCHRVVGQDGGLRGYRWGKQRKQALLSLENTGRTKTTNPS
jgi:AraC family transcriptional regulator of adaptative response/methylated-DNA-[protein]-cysteine methyltransferase